MYCAFIYLNVYLNVFGNSVRKIKFYYNQTIKASTLSEDCVFYENISQVIFEIWIFPKNFREGQDKYFMC